MLALNNLCLKYVEVTFYQVRERMDQDVGWWSKQGQHRLHDLFQSTLPSSLLISSSAKLHLLLHWLLVSLFSLDLLLDLMVRSTFHGLVSFTVLVLQHLSHSMVSMSKRLCQWWITTNGKNMILLYIEDGNQLTFCWDRKLLHYNTTLAIMFLFPLVLFSGELGDIMSQSESIYDMGFWILMVSDEHDCILVGLAGSNICLSFL